MSRPYFYVSGGCSVRSGRRKDTDEKWITPWKPRGSIVKSGAYINLIPHGQVFSSTSLRHMPNFWLLITPATITQPSQIVSLKKMVQWVYSYCLLTDLLSFWLGTYQDFLVYHQSGSLLIHTYSCANTQMETVNRQTDTQNMCKHLCESVTSCISLTDRKGWRDPRRKKKDIRVTVKWPWNLRRMRNVIGRRQRGWIIHFQNYRGEVWYR